MDFEIVPVRTHYVFQTLRRDEVAYAFSDEAVDVPVLKVSAAEAPLVATVFGGLAQPVARIDFRSIEGKLFRPYLNAEHSIGVWTPETCRRLIPKMGLQDGCWAGDDFIPGLPNPFRAYGQDVSERTRKIGRRAAPDACEAARDRAAQAAIEGLRFVEGVLFQATRAPAWAICGNRIMACLPDFEELGQHGLVDARHSATKIVRRFPDMGFVAPRKMVVQEPSLLPNTADVDSIGSYCRLALARTLPHQDPIGHRKTLFSIVDLAKGALDGGPIPEEALDLLEGLSRVNDGLRSWGLADGFRFSDEAGQALRLLKAYPSVKRERKSAIEDGDDIDPTMFAP
jgi:hypothetical protein